MISSGVNKSYLNVELQYISGKVGWEWGNFFILNSYRIQNQPQLHYSTFKNIHHSMI